MQSSPDVGAIRFGCAVLFYGFWLMVGLAVLGALVASTTHPHP